MTTYLKEVLTQKKGQNLWYTQDKREQKARFKNEI
jgi:hypothetical protein